ncbi:UDP-glucosyltransferase 2-like isoform X2 [Vespa velutina]|uniref:UDP-glucosyltransferase 2-like isoform X2 n=1 Tax=Vespa velutina TaxID=202808 RepID=UPI001FB4E234|nr:UDP-glucosyltransferase 2-like isoform X2 [Vespa velutina]
MNIILILSIILIISRECGFLVDGFRILGICPSTSYSHQQPFQALMKALATRGHNVTVISTIPLKKSLQNYEDVDLSFTYRKSDCTGLRHMNAYEILRKNMKEANDLCVKQLFSEQIMELLTVGNLPYVMDSIGNPDDPMLNPDMAYPFTNRMSMDERIWNILYTSWTRFYYRYWHLPRAQRIANKFVPDTPLYDIDRNFSLIILGNNHVLGYPKPLLPNVIEVHSLQIKEQTESLPKDIREFLDDAINGAIYFSLGSNLQTHQLPNDPLTALCNALGSLKQRVLWKHAGDMAIQSSNIKFVKWVPQQAVLGTLISAPTNFHPLGNTSWSFKHSVNFRKQTIDKALLSYAAHPKVMAYMMQGGLQSLQEAVYHSVPLIVMPFFGDQHFNAKKILDAGIGLTLNVDTMTEELIVRTITEVVENKTYMHNIKLISAILKDELVRPMERAIWNIEHVLKFPNSKHLRYHGRDISWIDYYLTILVIFLIFTILIFIGCACFIVLGKAAKNYLYLHVKRYKYKNE